VLADDQVELMLKKTCRQALAVIGQDCMPTVEKAVHV
jgi:hypothetical protein